MPYIFCKTCDIFIQFKRKKNGHAGKFHQQKNSLNKGLKFQLASLKMFLHSRRCINSPKAFGKMKKLFDKITTISTFPSLSKFLCFVRMW